MTDLGASLDKNKKLEEAIFREGFALEWKSAEIFQTAGFKTESNLTMKNCVNKDADTRLEIDLIAYNERRAKGVYVCECKGTSSSNTLVVMEHSSQITLTNLRIEGEVDVHPIKPKAVTSFESGPAYCHSGDYFTESFKGTEFQGYKKLGKQHANLYKGNEQIIESVGSFFAHSAIQEHARSNLVWPLYITNAQIKAVQFKKGKERCVIEDVPWVAFRNVIPYPRECSIWKKRWYEYKFNDLDEIRHKRFDRAVLDRHLDYFWIVNVDKLKDFIASKDKKYTKD